MGKRRLEEDKAFSKHKRKKKRTKSSSSTSSSSSSLSSVDEETERKLLKKIKKLRRKEKKKKKKKKEKKALKKLMKTKLKEESLNFAKSEGLNSTSCDVDISLFQKSKNLAPMTKDEWEKQQNTFKRVYDEETGRMRLIKGNGEIVEECVSRDIYLVINKQATKGDGEFFQKKLLQQLK